MYRAVAAFIGAFVAFATVSPSQAAFGNPPAIRDVAVTTPYTGIAMPIPTVIAAPATIEPVRYYRHSRRHDFHRYYHRRHHHFRRHF